MLAALVDKAAKQNHGQTEQQQDCTGLCMSNSGQKIALTAGRSASHGLTSRGLCGLSSIGIASAHHAVHALRGLEQAVASSGDKGGGVP